MDTSTRSITLLHRSPYAFTYVETYGGKAYAVKKFPVYTFGRFDRPLYLGDGDVRLRSGREAVDTEIAILTLLENAENVVKIDEVRVGKSEKYPIQIVFRWAGSSVLVWREERYYPSASLLPMYTESELRQIMRQLLTGVKAIHDAGVIHKDLKPENILIDRKNDRLGNLAICDFGSASFGDRKFPIIHDAQGTLEFTPPEILLHGTGDGVKRDAWSVGVVFFCLLTGRLPWAERTEAAILRTDIARPASATDEVWELLHGLTERDPSHRWSPSHALTSSFIQNAS